MKRITVILVAIALTLSAAPIALASDTAVTTVKNGTLDAYPG